jgi:hypothetical protein
MCFLSLFAAVSIMKGKRSAFIYFWYQTDSGVLNTSIYSAVSMVSPYYNYLYFTASTTMICWRCHCTSVNNGSRLPYLSNVKTRKRRNVVGIDLIRNNRIIWPYVQIHIHAKYENTWPEGKKNKFCPWQRCMIKYNKWLCRAKHDMTTACWQ